MFESFSILAVWYTVLHVSNEKTNKLWGNIIKWRIDNMKLRSTSANSIIHTIWKFLERQYFRWGSHLIQRDFWVVWIQWTQLSYTRQHYTNHNQQSFFVENKTMYLLGSIIQNIPHPVQKCCIWYLVHIKIWMGLDTI